MTVTASGTDANCKKISINFVYDQQLPADNAVRADDLMSELKLRPPKE